ncbi:MAG: hypothetical protein Q9225_003240 [Loekoesia sp. 1 TL-2023]
MPGSASRSKGKKNGSTQQAGLMGSMSRFWHRSYAGDYVGFVLLLTGYILIQTIAEPFHRMFSLDDLAIQFPHAEVERVPVRYNILYSGIIPLLIILISTTLIHPSHSANRFHKLHVTVLGLLISLLLTSFLTDIFKNAIGRPRPDLLARCKPVKGTQSHKLVTIEVCTEKDYHTLHDGWRSFPSGHSSFAFSGLGYLSLFFAGQLHIFRPHTDFLRVLVTLTPLVCAAMIAISRCEDYRHDVYDVTVGSALGLLIAYFSYRRYYPSLISRKCDTPYPSRAETGMAESKKGKELDEEEMVGGVDDGSEDDENERVPLRKSSTGRGRRRSSAQ